MDSRRQTRRPFPAPDAQVHLVADATWRLNQAAGRCIAALDGDLFEGNVWNVLHSLLRVLDRNPADIALRIDIKERVLIEVTRLCDRRASKLDVERIGVLEVTNLHG